MTLPAKVGLTPHQRKRCSDAGWDRVQTTLRGAQAAHHAAQADAAAHQAKQERLAGPARDIEADAAAIVTQYLHAADQDAVCTLGQRFREVAEALQAVRALQEHARRKCPHRTVLPHVEPLSRPLQPGQLVGFEELLWIGEHDRAVQALLGGSE